MIEEDSVSRRDERSAGGCPSCGDDVAVPVLAKRGSTYSECSLCGLVHLDPVPTDVDAREYYEAGYFTGGAVGGYADYAADEALHRHNARHRLKLISGARSGPSGSLVDVGCAHGFFANEAARAGWRSVGVEIASAARETAVTRFGLEVHADLGVLAAHRPAGFDVVTFFQVLEHLTRPATALAAARACLRREGRLVIETWDRGSLVARMLGSQWHQVNPPSVVSLFDRADLRRLLYRAGFHRIRVRRTAKYVSVRLVARLLSEQYPRFAESLQFLADRTIGDLAIPYVLGDLITVVATPRAAVQGEEGRPS